MEVWSSLYNVSEVISDEEEDSSVVIHGEDGVHNDPAFYSGILILRNYVNTSIATLGIIGNIFSTIVLRKSGLHKSSNILLFVLGIADSFFLVGMVNFVGRMYHTANPRGWYGSRNLCFFFFVVWQLHSNCYLIGHFVSALIPALITTERLIATLYPLKFKTVVTPRRVWVAIFVCLIIAITYAMFESATHLMFFYHFSQEMNVSFAVMAYRPKSEGLLLARDIVKRTFFFCEGIVPILYVSIGCAIIGFHIKLAKNKRKEIAAGTSEKKTNTTGMLISVCVVYVISCSFYAMIRMFPKTRMRNRVRMFEDLFLSLNSSVNPIIYVVFNKNFSEALKSVLLCRKIPPSGKM